MPMRMVPWCLITVRSVLAPIVAAMAILHAPGAVIAAALVVACLSDVFDGIVARRLGVADERLRVADSWVDAWFYLCVAAAAWIVHGELIRQYRWPIGVLLFVQLTSYVIDLARYRRIASFHAYSAKAWGLGLCVAAVALPEWRHDVPSCVHALPMRRVRGVE